ncbi:vacuolar protein sorting-associated protein 54-like isoform X2 [Watersipora subatra]|uniref:vacuolar protein sorting-associated protein 54-like isoform X2 n=1 Tax=Watersipora subatra TaxID=2589382 RepID=UPI00355BF6BC
MLGRYDPSANISAVPWKSCRICKEEQFRSPKDFSSHLKMVHCRREGGSYICTYGPNMLCKNLPLEGVSGKDYDAHLSRYHIAPRADLLLDKQRAETHYDNQTDNLEALTVTAEQKVRDVCTGESKQGQNQKETNLDASHSRECKKDKRWTIYDAKVNMAALLNDPRPGKRQADFFTKTWGVGWTYLDLTPSPEIPEVTIDHFRSYQKKILPRIAKHESVQSSLADVKVPIDTFPHLYLRAHDKHSQDVGKIPSIFHSPTFDLSNSDMFHQVFPWQDIETSQKSQKLYQEKLSHYLDIVEVQIARQVALKSDAFFHVMSSHEELQSRLAACTSTIHTLRSKMRELSSRLIQNPLRVLTHSRKRQRLQGIAKKLKLMSTLHQTQPTVQILLSSSDYVGALDIISTAQEVLQKELAGVLSFRHLGSQLTELEKAINTIVANEFLSFITQDLNKPLAEVSAAIDETVISYVSASDTGNSDNSTVADQMRTLNFNKWLLLMDDIFHNLLIVVNRVKALCELMRALSCEAAGLDEEQRSSVEENDEREADSRSPTESQEEGGQMIITEMFADKICRELRELLIRICEFANERCSKVITARSRDLFIEKLSSHEFFSLTSSVERFAKSCDQICGTKISSNSVRGCLQGYNIRFLNKFHEERKNKLNLLLDNERWRPADVPGDFQALLTHCELCEQLTMSDEVADSDSPVTLAHISLANRRFVIVGSALALVKMTIEYCTCLEDLPKSAPDILSKLTEIIKLFNSRSSQLVLGAGALRLAGLKTITAKNLALLQSSLELMLHYLPLIRGQFSVYLTESKALMLRHLDHEAEEYRQHIKVVREKTREIASGMIDSCVNQWEIRPPMPSLCFRTLCKQLKKFYEALCDVIEPSQLQQLFRDVNLIVRGKLKDRLSALNISLLTGPQQGLIMADIAYFTENCSTLVSTQKGSAVNLTLTINDIIVSR